MLMSVSVSVTGSGCGGRGMEEGEKCCNAMSIKGSPGTVDLSELM